MSEKSEKNYKHDCESCTYLGADIIIHGDDKQTVDMYFCPQGGLPTLVMRYNDAPEDYTSVPIKLIIDDLDKFTGTPFITSLLISEDMLLWDREKI